MTDGRVAQLPVEVVETNPSDGRLAQVGVEVVETNPSAGRLGQLPVEVVSTATSPGRLAQLPIEVVTATLLPITAGQDAFIAGANPLQNMSSSQSAWIGGATITYDLQYTFIEGADTVIYPNRTAIHFDKNNQSKVEFPDNLNIRPTNSITVNFWVRPLENGTNQQRHYLAKVTSSTFNTTIYVATTSTTDNKFSWGVGFESVGLQTATSVASYNLNKWHMVTITYNGAISSFYVNGVLDSTIVGVNGPLRWDTGPWRVGWHPVGLLYTTMDFADLQIWGDALTSTEVGLLYHGPYIASAQGCFVLGQISNAITSEPKDCYISSSASSSNPSLINSSQGCVIAFAAIDTNNKCYLVGGDINEETFDFQILLDNFKGDRWDVIIRIGGAGERVVEFQKADVVYPITRSARYPVPGLFFSDMPGEIFETQQMFVHSGWAIDTPEGDLSGTTNVGPQVLMCFFPGVLTSQSYNRIFMSGPFTTITGGQDCYINTANDTYQLAYITGVPVPNMTTIKYCWISGDVSTISVSGPAGYLKGWQEVTDFQNSYLVANSPIQSFSRAYITSTAIGGIIETNQDTDNHMYIYGAAVVFDPVLDCFIYGNYVLTNQQNAFITVQPTIEGSQGAYIRAPFASLPDNEMFGFISGWTTITSSTNAFLQASLNIEDNQPSYIYGLDTGEGTKFCFIKADLSPAVQLSDTGIRGFIKVASELSDSQFCVISGVMTGTQFAFIMHNDSPSNISDTHWSYILSFESLSDSNTAYTMGHEKITGSSSAYIEGV